MTTTHDISEFTANEIEEACRLLSKYSANKDILGDGVQLAYDTASGYVYLIDANFNRAMINLLTNDIELFYQCPECDCEGFKDELMNESECCRKFISSL